jgi:hypothetical protein
MKENSPIKEIFMKMKVQDSSQNVSQFDASPSPSPVRIDKEFYNMSPCSPDLRYK